MHTQNRSIEEIKYTPCSFETIRWERFRKHSQIIKHLLKSSGSFKEVNTDNYFSHWVVSENLGKLNAVSYNQPTEQEVSPEHRLLVNRITKPNGITEQMQTGRTPYLSSRSVIVSRYVRTAAGGSASDSKFPSSAGVAAGGSQSRGAARHPTSTPATCLWDSWIQQITAAGRWREKILACYGAMPFVLIQKIDELG